ncbi:MAG: hypothetical protein ACTHNE_14935 [Dyella sp.]|uniref:hypothetical protein n=1 Tax=Dyella sp. TaxID=1869338 RepID=UPI003F7D4DF1
MHSKQAATPKYGTEAQDFCPHLGYSPPQKVPNLKNIASIAFVDKSVLMAVDRDGAAWAYYQGNASCTKAKPLKVFPIKQSVDEPEAGKLLMIASSLSGAVGVTDSGRARSIPTDQYKEPPCSGGGNQCHYLGDNRIAQEASGHWNALLLRKDGTVWSWGKNDCGQLGREVRPLHEWTTEPVEMLHNVIAVGAGMRNSMALTRDGTVFVWGNMSDSFFNSVAGTQPVANFNYCDRHVNEHFPFLSSDPNSFPAKVQGLPPIEAISTFHAFDLALDRDGHVWGWGYNSCGQLGIDPVGEDPKKIDERMYQASPVRIAGLVHITAIAAGKRHALALDAEGNVWAWGENSDGELGEHRYAHVSYSCGSETDLTAVAPYSPYVAKVPGIGKVTAIAAGYNSSAALDENGEVWVWGRH